MPPEVTRNGEARESGWFWATLMLSCVSVVAVVFALWELLENRFFRDVDYVTLHYLYMSRGIGSSLVLAVWAAWYVLRQRRRSEDALRASRERYRHLLEASPGAVALYDAGLRVSEWNAAAERLYGFAKEAVLGRPLPTVPPDRQRELRGLMDEVAAGRAVLDVETVRHDARAARIEVQLNLLPFSEGPGACEFMEVTADIREKIRLRQTLLELEKLTTMGKMAAGTAHHLNTPLAAALLRLQMMQDRPHDPRCAADLQRLEDGLHFCQQFVQSLLQFSRRPAAKKHPEALRATLESVLGFVAPQLTSKHARLSLDVGAIDGERVFADRNLLESLFLILISNALDAIAEGGSITVRCGRCGPEAVEVRITDDGPGVAAQDLPRLFEPFFTTKTPGKGTGLGLAIARNIVNEHGGSVRLENVGGGAAAVVELPLYLAPRATA